MIEISFKSQDGSVNPFDSFFKEINATDEEVQKQLNDIAEETAKKMIDVITDNKVRPQSDEPTELESHINAEVFEGGFGVGDIQELNDEVGYWAAINWGSSHMVGRRVPNGFFQPGQANPTPDAFRQGRWKKSEDIGGMAGGNTGFPGTGKAHWSFVVNQPIPPMNYIEKTATWLDTRLDSLDFK